MNRRRFLRNSGAFVAVGVASAACQPDDPFDPREVARPALLKVLGPATVQDIGRRHLERLPSAARTAEALRAAIACDANDARTWPWSSPPTLDELVARDFATDSADNRLVTPGGWVLSVTEARQCALAALVG